MRVTPQNWRQTIDILCRSSYVAAQKRGENFFDKAPTWAGYLLFSQTKEELRTIVRTLLDPKIQWVEGSVVKRALEYVRDAIGEPTAEELSAGIEEPRPNPPLPVNVPCSGARDPAEAPPPSGAKKKGGAS